LERIERKPDEVGQSPVMQQKLERIEQMLGEGKQNPNFYPDNDRLERIEKLLDELKRN